MNDDRPTILDLFSGVGGFSFAFEGEGFRTLAFSEIDEAASAVLKYWWPEIANVGRIENIGSSFLEAFGRPDVITGGIPCQAISLLGKRLGPADDRWLWPEFIRVIGELRPRFAVAENPPAILTHDNGRTFNGIVSAFSAIGFDCMWDVIPAAMFGAGHLRKRLCFVAANSDECGNWQRPDGNCAGEAEQALRLEPADGNSERRGETGRSALVRVEGGNASRSEFAAHGCEQDGVAADGGSKGLQGQSGDGAGREGRAETQRPVRPADLRGRVNGPDWWHEHVTGVPVLVHGLPSKLVEAYCRCSGNAIVPQAFQPIAQAIYHQLKNLK